MTALAIVRDVRRRYSADTAGCADALLALDEVLSELKKERRKKKKKEMKMKKLLALSALALSLPILTSCATSKPLAYACMGCAVLQAVACPLLTTRTAPTPPCADGMTAYILNFDEVFEEGATPVIDCRFDKK